MPSTSTTHHEASRRDVLRVDARELRDTIRVTIDRELITQIDRQRGSVSRSAYLEMVLTAALAREHPHLPEDYSAERAAQHRYERRLRYVQTGR